MKHLILTAVLVSGLTLLAASGASAQQDSLKRKKFDINYGLGVTIGEKRDSTGKIDQSKGRFVGGITFTRFDIGFSRLIDNGPFEKRHHHPKQYSKPNLYQRANYVQ